MMSKTLSNHSINPVQLVNVPIDLFGAFYEAGLKFVHHGRIGLNGHVELLSLNGLQMLDGHLQNVGLFQFSVTRGLYKGK